MTIRIETLQDCLDPFTKSFMILDKNLKDLRQSDACSDETRSSLREFYKSLLAPDYADKQGEERRTDFRLLTTPELKDVYHLLGQSYEDLKHDSSSFSKDILLPVFEESFSALTPSLYHYKYYAGIGSRETPPDVLEKQQSLARRLNEDGWTLRSGGAPGADDAFERGILRYKNGIYHIHKSDGEIFIPWNGFKGDDKSHSKNFNEGYCRVDLDRDRIAGFRKLAALEENFLAKNRNVKKMPFSLALPILESMGYVHSDSNVSLDTFTLKDLEPLESSASSEKASSQFMLLGRVARYHPAPSRLSEGAVALMSRNGCQMKGLDLRSPSDAVVCFTLDGRLKGGTAQALRMAIDDGIPILNMGLSAVRKKTIEELSHIMNTPKDLQAYVVSDAKAKEMEDYERNSSRFSAQHASSAPRARKPSQGVFDIGY